MRFTVLFVSETFPHSLRHSRLTRQISHTYGLISISQYLWSPPASYIVHSFLHRCVVPHFIVLFQPSHCPRSAELRVGIIFSRGYPAVLCT
jgi:hypothetical protein